MLLLLGLHILNINNIYIWTGAAELHWTSTGYITSDIHVHILLLPTGFNEQSPYTGLWWKQNIVHEIE